MSFSTKANIEVDVDVDIWDVYDALDAESQAAFIVELLEDVTDSVDGITPLLDGANQESLKSYIQRHFRPCDIFESGDLEAWALYYGYEKVKR